MKTHCILFVKGFREIKQFLFVESYFFMQRPLSSLVLVARLKNFNILECPDAVGIYKVFTSQIRRAFRVCFEQKVQFSCVMSISLWHVQLGEQVTHGHAWLDVQFEVQILLFENISRMGQSFTCKASSYNLCGKETTVLSEASYF